MNERPSGFSAVMNQRAPVDPDTLDYFPTPPWAARAGGELIARLDPEARRGRCWEPAAGGGHMAMGLADYFAQVVTSDICQHEDGDPVDKVADFLDPETAPPYNDAVDWIVTNPPFVHGGAFVSVALLRARRGVAMLLRLNFLEGQKRFELLFGVNPVTVVAPFAERVPMVKGRWDPASTTATAYAWFVWLKGHPPGPRLEPIAPGARKRLSRSSDARLARAAPKFDRDAFDALFSGDIGDE